MDWITKYLSELGIGAVVIAFTGFLIKYLSQKKIDSYFNKELSKFQGEVNILTEQTKYTLAKKLYDFEAYAIKKHNIYPDLYKHLFSGCMEATEINIALENKNLSDDELKKLFDRMDELQVTHKNWLHYFASIELYLSDEVSEKVKLIHTRLINFMLSIDVDNVNEVRKELRETFDELKILKDILQKELSYSQNSND